MNGVSDLSRMELEDLVRFFTYHMGLDQRGQLMGLYPKHYNKLCGQTIVKVVHANDGREY